MNKLDDELKQARRTISTDSYPMSIGELTNLFVEGDLIIRPAYQRLFRWEDDQKSKLIESILIGIPLPSIFVAQDENGRWELVDGLQRVCTILQLQGHLEQFPPLEMVETKYLPSLEGLKWGSEEEDSEDPCLSPAQRRDIKRAKLDIKIVQRDSDPKTKYDLFQRLNSFGSPLSRQEIRNAQLVGINDSFVEWLTKLAANDDFSELIAISENEKKQKYDEELVLRFLYLFSKSDAEIGNISNFQEGLEAFAVKSAMGFGGSYESDHAERVFKETFKLLRGADQKILGRWNRNRNELTGGFLNTSFEALAIPLGNAIHSKRDFRSDLKQCAVDFWSSDEMKERFATGKSTEARIRIVMPLGRKIILK